MSASSRRILIMIITSTIGITFLVYNYPSWEPQQAKLKLIGEWMDEVKEEVDQYKAENELEFTMYGYTAGMVGVNVQQHESALRVEEIKKYLESQSPPTPIKWAISFDRYRTTDYSKALEYIEEYKAKKALEDGDRSMPF